MAIYLVTATPIRSKMNDLCKWLDSGDIRAMHTFGQNLQMGLDNPRWQSDEVAIWEVDYCVPPLAHERAAVLDEYFTELEVQHVNKDEGWKKINSLEKFGSKDDYSS